MKTINSLQLVRMSADEFQALAKEFKLWDKFTDLHYPGAVGGWDEMPEGRFRENLQGHLMALLTEMLELEEHEYITFDFLRPKNGIGNNWRRLITVHTRTQEIQTGVLSSVNDMYGYQIVSILDSAENLIAPARTYRILR